jgi:hypothetical protein
MIGTHNTSPPAGGERPALSTRRAALTAGACGLAAIASPIAIAEPASAAGGLPAASAELAALIARHEATGDAFAAAVDALEIAETAAKEAGLDRIGQDDVIGLPGLGVGLSAWIGGEECERRIAEGYAAWEKAICAVVRLAPETADALRVGMEAGRAADLAAVREALAAIARQRRDIADRVGLTAAEDEWARTAAADDAALDAIAALPCASLADARMKCAYLLTGRRFQLEEETMRAVLASFAGEPAGAEA